MYHAIIKNRIHAVEFLFLLDVSINNKTTTTFAFSDIVVYRTVSNSIIKLKCSYARFFVNSKKRRKLIEISECVST